PTADISAALPLQFFGIREAGALIAVVGLELYPPVGLLRSLAVRTDFRQHGLGRELVAFAEAHAAAQGVEALFLLTTSAARFFLGLGYSPAARDQAPTAIRASTQFAALCPASSAFLAKHLSSSTAPGKQELPPGQAQRS
ncbi:MAG TPA: GNAT family N-acetyltransferase, partial [Azospira sp.]|nr:GNAT family N-acetyltransferase [Azospira sp.]